MEKYDTFFHDKCPCSKTSMLVFEQGHLSWKNLSRAIFAGVIYLSSALVKCTCQGKLVIFFIYTIKGKSETFHGKTGQVELASVYSQQVFLDKGTCQGNLLV